MSTALDKLIKKLEDLEAQMRVACDLDIPSEARQKIIGDLLEQHRVIAKELMAKGFREKLDGSEELAARIFSGGSALSIGDQ
ncbi:hypothetical protein [Agrobacterium tumefaciens]|jgi:hypothetical protein|uniref:hypothetical protein n=1 Tax=Agrobacterium tumefaciens TaxID=358 RepID=UPI000DCFE6CC|nr:hypothetical protein FY143_25225 [Agrobacterium tumefaciens]